METQSPPRALLHSQIGFNNELPVIDNIYLFGAIHGVSRRELSRKIDDIFAMAGLTELSYALLKDLSLGQQQRLALSIFSQSEADFLIFDESLAFIDECFVQKCEAYFRSLASSDKTIIIASHNIDFLNKYCQKALWIDNGHVHRYGDIKMVTAEYLNCQQKN